MVYDPPAREPRGPMDGRDGTPYMTEFAGDALACIRAERLVFKGLSFTLGDGGALRLTGPNGSGKSSLLRVMAGFIRPALGSLTWDGAEVTKDREAHGGRLAFIGHLDAAKPVLTVEESVRFWARLYGAEDPAASTGAALEAFDLKRLADFPVRLLSSGQRRRLALCRLLAAPAKLWLLDEPTTGLDTASVARLEAVIAGHREAGGLVVLATHTEVALPRAETLTLEAFTPEPETADEEIA
jgi:heme exporter protein A